MNEAIAEATDNNNELTFTHVAIFFEEGGSDSVLEATSPGGISSSSEALTEPSRLISITSPGSPMTRFT